MTLTDTVLEENILAGSFRNVSVGSVESEPVLRQSSMVVTHVADNHPIMDRK